MQKISKKPVFKSPLTVIVLAAGKGTRMASPLPKVVHPVAGVPMIQRIVGQVKRIGAQEVRVVVGYGEVIVKQLVEPLGAICKKQHNQLGTGDAVKSAGPFDMQGMVLILNGDHPLILEEDLVNILKEFEDSPLDVAVVSAKLKNPKSFGRIVRHKNELAAIVEAKDASHETLKINEVNTGIYVARAEVLKSLLPQISNQNAQQEYYLTDIIEICRNQGGTVGAIEAPRRVSFGVNNQLELSQATRVLYRRKAKALMEEGVMILDPHNVYIDESVSIGAASVVYPGAVIRGNTTIGQYCVIEANCMISQAQIADSVVVKAMSHLEDCTIETQAQVGPYVRLRPGAEVGENARLGNFVELKNVKFGKDSKAGHLTYLGDAEIGENVNIGCGTITCNYAADRKKYKTIIGDHSFIGSDTQFVAPVTVGAHSVVGSGSTITKNVPEGALAVARGKQFIKSNYVDIAKKKSED